MIFSAVVMDFVFHVSIKISSNTGIVHCSNENETVSFVKRPTASDVNVF